MGTIKGIKESKISKRKSLFFLSIQEYAIVSMLTQLEIVLSWHLTYCNIGSSPLFNSN